MPQYHRLQLTPNHLKNRAIKSPITDAYEDLLLASGISANSLFSGCTVSDSHKSKLVALFRFAIGLVVRVSRRSSSRYNYRCSSTLISMGGS